ncbi:MinD/ParA family protein [Priestia endophytica]|uniref:MinD/ParA family protein n=1 Tax=Priestia endophytica TaxID=135735 RepID=UPI00124EA994|nr:MinD/ParA family protein [Priestia endophytica]KAB2494679.1 MinD/ParA family protein [Priestia endophytica]
MMKDQAERLRLKMQGIKKTKALAVLSGKGGVGKSHFSINFALSLHKLGYKVLLFDMDVGMGNVEILMGISTQYTIADVLHGNVSVQEAVSKSSYGIDILSGGTGLNTLVEMDEGDITHLLSQFDVSFVQYDYVIFDMGAGMAKSVLSFLKAADEIVVLITPEPTSLMDGYASVKFMMMESLKGPYNVVINKTSSLREGEIVFGRINKVTEKFLNGQLSYLGRIPTDSAVTKATMKQVPFSVLYPNGKATKAVEELVASFVNPSSTQSSKGGFLARLKHQFLEKRERL